MNATRLKRALLLFWAVWLTVVFATNFCDALKALKILDADWPFASGNFKFVSDTTARYAFPTAVNGILFAGVLLWEGLAAGLFWLAVLRFGRGAAPFLYPAFAAGLMLWAAFAVTDEVMIAYAVEGTHLRLFSAQLLTLLVVVLLPND